MNLEDEELVENLARYLIEDNYEEFVEYDEDLTLSVIVVKSILRNLLGAYKIYDEEGTAELRGRIREVNIPSIFHISNFFSFSAINKTP